MGPRGLTVLSIAGIAGLLFGVVGWKQAGIDTAAASPVAATASPAGTSSPSATASVPASAAAGAGPLLSSMPYASFAYLVWPGPASADGKLAMSRWKLTVTRQAQPQLSQSFIQPIPHAFFKLSFPLREIRRMQRKRFRRHFSEPIWGSMHLKANPNSALG